MSPSIKGDCLFVPGQIILEYSSAVWVPFRLKYIDKLVTIQRSAAILVI